MSFTAALLKSPISAVKTTSIKILDPQEAEKKVLLIKPGTEVLTACLNDPHGQNGPVRVRRAIMGIYESSNRELLNEDMLNAGMNIRQIDDGKVWYSPKIQGVNKAYLPAPDIKQNHYYRIAVDSNSPNGVYFNCDGITEIDKGPLCGNGICDKGESRICHFGAGFTGLAGTRADDGNNVQNVIASEGLVNSQDLCPASLVSLDELCPEDCEPNTVNIFNTTTTNYDSFGNPINTTDQNFNFPNTVNTTNDNTTNTTTDGSGPFSTPKDTTGTEPPTSFNDPGGNNPTSDTTDTSTPNTSFTQSDSTPGTATTSEFSDSDGQDGPPFQFDGEDIGLFETVP